MYRTQHVPGQPPPPSADTGYCYYCYYRYHCASFEFTFMSGAAKGFFAKPRDQTRSHALTWPYAISKRRRRAWFYFCRKISTIDLDFAERIQVGNNKKKEINRICDQTR